MPTVARRPAAQQQRDRLQARRLAAAELFATQAVRQPAQRPPHLAYSFLRRTGLSVA